jgi:type VII secretion protein EccE
VDVPQPTRTQLVLLEVAGAAGVLGYAARTDHRTWTPVGFGVAAVALLLAVVPLERRWLYQTITSWLALAGRRRRVRSAGLSAVLGEYAPISVTDGSDGRGGAALRYGSMWSVPLTIRVDDLFNEDKPVPVDALASLLSVEDVPVSSVRVVTMTLPSTPAAGAAAGPDRPAPRVAARYCVLTVDATAASEAIATRGGSDAAVAQILRRCALRAAEILEAGGLSVTLMDERAIAAMMTICLGTDAYASPQAGASESWNSVHTDGGVSTTLALGGDAARLFGSLAGVCSSVPAELVVDALVLEPGPSGSYRTTQLVRVNGPADVVSVLSTSARRAGLVVQRLGGQQGGLLRATTPLAWRAS